MAELRDYWDYFVYVDGETRVRDERIVFASAGCPRGILAFWHLAHWSARLERYAGGQRRYLDTDQPRALADAVVDNNDLLDPALFLRADDRP